MCIGFVIFAKTCFESAVGGWSARRGKNTGFLIAFFGFSHTDLIAHTPEVVGSSPASATRKRKTTQSGGLFFFLCKADSNNVNATRTSVAAEG